MGRTVCGMDAAVERTGKYSQRVRPMQIIRLPLAASARRRQRLSFMGNQITYWLYAAHGNGSNSAAFALRLVIFGYVAFLIGMVLYFGLGPVSRLMGH